MSLSLLLSCFLREGRVLNAWSLSQRAMFKVLWCVSCGLSCHTVGNTVASHLFALELSKHIGYLNTFSKTTPTISGYFHRWEAGCSCSNGWYQVVQCSLYPLYGSWRFRIASTGKVGFSSKVSATVKVSRWVLLAYCMRPVEWKPSNGLRLCVF